MTERRYTNHRTGEIVDDPTIRPFRDVLSELGEGQTERELSEALWDLIQRVEDTTKAGSVTLTLSVAFDGHGRLVVKDEVKVKLPEYNRPTTSFYVDREGNASRRNPGQPEIPGVANLDARRTSGDA